MPLPEDPQTARDLVADAAHRLAAAGLVKGTSGNLSARLADGRIAVSPTGGKLAELDPGDVAIVAADGTHLDGPFAATSEIDLHTGAYARYDVGAVVHTHSPVATVLACVLDELPLIHYGLLSLGGPIRVAPYRTFGTPEIAAVTLDALEGRAAALMGNHGALAVGSDLEAAMQTAELLEHAADLYWRAAQVGTPRALTVEDADAVAATIAARGYGSTQRA